MDVVFAAVSLIPFAGVAGKAVEIGGKEGVHSSSASALQWTASPMPLLIRAEN